MEEFFGANKQQTGMTKVLGEIVAQKKGRRWATIRAESVLWWRRHAINPRFSVKRGDKMKLNCLLF